MIEIRINWDYLKKLLFGKKCGDCGCRYRSWLDHLLSSRHKKWMFKNHPEHAKRIYEELHEPF